jgi:hypothetical protein
MDGPSWEALCQQVFKRKFGSDGYQEMPASPGDFGIEGYTASSGLAFQCYCPDNHYTRSELYDKQRDKITEDLQKLKDYEKQLQERLGTTKIEKWLFVTPEIDRNKLLKHAKTKEAEVRKWGLPFLSDNFTVLVQDGDHYLIEINQIRTAAGEAVVFDDTAPVLAELTGSDEEYEKNVIRKSKIRLSPKKEQENFDIRVEQMSQRTIERCLEADGFLRKVSDSSPSTYMKLVRLINEYEQHVVDTSATWAGTAEELTDKVQQGLTDLIHKELSPEFEWAYSSKAARLMTSRWLAVCELDYG